MTIQEAYDKGLLKKGSRVMCNGDGHRRMDFYSGTISSIDHPSVCIKRDDGGHGGGRYGTWIVYLEPIIEIFTQEVSYFVIVKHPITNTVVLATYNGSDVYIKFTKGVTLNIGDELTILGWKQDNKIYVTYSK